MKLTASISYPCGAQFWILDGPDDRETIEVYAREEARKVGGAVSAIEPTTPRDITELENDRVTPARSYKMWVEMRVPTP